MSSSAPNSSNPWFGVSLALIGFIVGYGFHSMSSSGLTATAQPSAQVPTAPSVPDAPAAPTGTPAGVDDDPVLGDENAPITLIEFTDYQCPFCGRHFEQTYGQIKSQYVDTGKVKLVVRDYPLSFHPFAQKSAEASECADDQGKFWEMHDKLFAGQTTWSGLPDAVPTFKQYAQELGLDTGRFNDCLDSGTHAQEIAQDMADGSASGVNGTPGFWVIGPGGNGQYISGAQPFSAFQQAFDSMN